MFGPGSNPAKAFPRVPGRVRSHRLGNYLKTAVLMAGLTALFLAVGDKLGGPQGMLWAGTFVVGLNFITYWFSDRIALALNRAVPLEPGQLPWLHDTVARLAHRAGMPTPRLFLIPTPAPNAFATGRNPGHAAVAVTEGILHVLDRRELTGVLAHELSHIKNRDTLISTIAATLAGIITQVARLAFWFGGSFFGGGRDRDEEGHGSVLGSLGMLIVAPIAAMLLQLAISRSREYGADATGAALSDDPNALADALQKLERGAEAIPYDQAPATAPLFIVNPLTGGGLMRLFSTHPSTEERVKRLRELAHGGLIR
ncbi:MAG: zinc metalloprotease HtpX [Deltaproteobacteria bacterium]|nr:zinc metalloprotease HtpX [Deltaproteobacteria bacterium]